MHRLILRPAFAFTTFVLVVLAVLQITGRIGMALAYRLEPAVNEILATQHVSVRGLSGSWRGLNPVIHAAEITFPAGFVRRAHVELDWLESLGRGHLVLQHAEVDDALVALERTERGWWLAGMQRGASRVDVWPIINHSDELRLRGRVMVVERPDSVVDIEVKAVNRGGYHGADLNLSSRACDECVLAVVWRRSDPLWGVDEGWERLWAKGEVALPGGLFDWPGRDDAILVPRVSVRADWSARGGIGGGSGEIGVLDVALPDGVRTSAVLAAGVRSEGDIHHGEIDRLQWRVDDEAVEFASIFFEGSRAGVQLWMRELTMAKVGEIRHALTNALRGMEKGHEWLVSLNPGGKLLNLRGFVGTGELAYAATVADIALDGHRGIPFTRNASTEVVGYEHGLRLSVNATDLQLGFPATFRDDWDIEQAQGMLDIWFGNGYIGIRAPAFAVVRGTTHAAGSLALVRPPQRDETRLSLLIAVDQASVAQAKTYVPYKLPEAVTRWLADGPRKGRLSDITFAFHGRVKAGSPAFTRRFALDAAAEQATVSYHPDWPLASEVSGHLSLSGRRGTMTVRDGHSLGAVLRGGEVRLHDNGAWLEVELDTQFDAGAGLDFIRQSPLAQTMPFVTQEWSASGPAVLRGVLVIPLNKDRASVSLDADLMVSLEGIGLHMPEWRMPLEGLTGEIGFRYPRLLTSHEVNGTLLGYPIQTFIVSDEHSVRFSATGRASPDVAWHLADMRGWPFVTGTFDYQAELSITPDGPGVEVRINTDLAGVGVELPALLGKTARAARQSSMNLQFLDEYTALRFEYGDVNGWLHLDGAPVRGSVGLGVAHPMVASDASVVVVSGELERVDLEEFVAITEQVGDRPVNWRLRNVRLGELVIGDTPVPDMRVDGERRSEAAYLAFDSDMAAGELTNPDSGPLLLDLKHVRLPGYAPEEQAGGVSPLSAGGEVSAGEDPLHPHTMATLPRADVTIAEAIVGEDHLGSWSFAVEPKESGVAFTDIAAKLKGVDLTSPGGLWWDASHNRSSGEVRLSMGDLADVLPQWGYAPSLESEQASIEAALSWPGSPLNIAIEGLAGSLEFGADNGRFLEADGSGALRIFSLLNFTAITKRLSFDFSDVVGKGVSFDTIRASVDFDAGVMRFREPMVVDGTGSKFQIGGAVNLVDESLDGEMILTLPVGKGLPWYAVYMGLANPLLGVGVLVGERVLRKPLEQVSSFKYRITGELADPQVEFVSMFGAEMENAEMDAGR